MSQPFIIQSTFYSLWLLLSSLHSGIKLLQLQDTLLLFVLQLLATHANYVADA
jgi:hypothetical protein